MQSHKLEIELSDSIVNYLQMDDEKLKRRVFLLLLADIARQGIISFGKAAELAEIDKMAFITEVGHMGIPYFNEDISDVKRDTETISQTMAGVTH